MAKVALGALKDALNEVDFPASKEDLVLGAEQSNSSEEVQKALRTLPPVDYGNIDEVIRSVTVDVGSSPDRPR